MSTRHLFAFSATLCALAACSPPPPNVQDEAIKTPAESAPETCNVASYPCGPYGYQIGDVIPDIAFVGRVAPTDSSTAGVIRMSDFFKDKSTKVIALLIAAEWCPPCQQEQGELVDSWKAYQQDGKGVAYLEALTQSTDGSRADLATIDRWVARRWTNYSNGEGDKVIPFPMAIDPAESTVPYGLTAYPTRIIIQASDMTIQAFGQGYAPRLGSLEADIEQVLSANQ